MPRNFEIEKRIKANLEYNHKNNVNLYGGMGMDSASPKEKLLREEELEYMKNHPELYKL